MASKNTWRIRSLGLITVTAILLAGLATQAEAASRTGQEGHHTSVTAQTSYNVASINDESTETPALASYNGQLYIAWQSTESQQYLDIASASPTDGYTFGPSATVANNGTDEYTSTGPAMAVYDGELWIAWVSTDSKHSINLAYTTNGTTISAPVLVGTNSTDYTPSLTVFDGELYIAWTGTDSHHHLNIAYTTNGTTFSDPVQLGSNSSDAGPSIGTFGTSTLIYAFTGTNASNTLNTESSTDGTTFGSQEAYSNIGSPYAPAIVYIPDATAPELWLEFTGSDTQLNQSFSLDGTSFVLPETIAEYSNNGPAVATDGTNIFIAWTGTNSSSSLNVIYGQA
jgi:hypothetical protein